MFHSFVSYSFLKLQFRGVHICTLILVGYMNARAFESIAPPVQFAFDTRVQRQLLVTPSARGTFSRWTSGGVSDAAESGTESGCAFSICVRGYGCGCAVFSTILTSILTATGDAMTFSCFAFSCGPDISTLIAICSQADGKIPQHMKIS